MSIYSKHPSTGEICFIKMPIFYFVDDKLYIGCKSNIYNEKSESFDSWDVFLSEYGKTWAFTREELCN